jgi:hypothetical protein
MTPAASPRSADAGRSTWGMDLGATYELAYRFGYALG